MENHRTKVMMSLAGGGHLWQSLSVMKSLDKRYEFCFFTTKRSSVPERETFPPGKIFYVRDVATMSTVGVVQKVSGPIASFFDCMSAIKAARPTVIIGVGSAISVPMLIAARLLGVPGIFIESVTRVSDLSLTGQIILRLGLAKRVYVQWPEVNEKYPKTKYEGTVM